MYVRNMMPLYEHRGHGHGDVNGEGESISNLYDEKTHEIALLCHLTLPSTHNNILLGRLLLLLLLLLKIPHDHPSSLAILLLIRPHH